MDTYEAKLGVTCIETKPNADLTWIERFTKYRLCN